ncbi:hypothetical protein ACH5RR_001016 [Cinchona calisaya]|uniref:Reverse transcriptase n=1 Tax=Cinchona calisaya TaxID=153742 RepID=A0ABD3B2S5_9GENT
MLLTRVHAEEYIGFRLRKGEVSFWFDNWSGEGAFHSLVHHVYEPDLTVNQIWRDSSVADAMFRLLPSLIYWFMVHLEGLLDSLIERKTVKLIPIIWNPSPLDVHKLNCDGASKGNLGLASRGGIIRSSSGCLKPPQTIDSVVQ